MGGERRGWDGGERERREEGGSERERGGGGRRGGGNLWGMWGPRTLNGGSLAKHISQMYHTRAIIAAIMRHRMRGGHMLGQAPGGAGVGVGVGWGGKDQPSLRDIVGSMGQPPKMYRCTLSSFISCSTRTTWTKRVAPWSPGTTTSGRTPVQPCPLLPLPSLSLSSPPLPLSYYRVAPRRGRTTVSITP